MFRLILLLALSGEFAAGQTSRNQLLQQDLTFFATQLPKVHANAFHQISQQQFNLAVNNLSANIPSITDQQFYAGMAAIAAMIGDAHTHLYLLTDSFFHSGPAVNLGFTTFPFQLRWLDDGAFVEAAAPEYAQTLGTQLVMLGNTPVADAVTTLSSIISDENDQWLHWMAQHYLAAQQVMQALGILPPGTSSQLTFQKRSGEQFTVSMTGGPPASLTYWSGQTAGFLPDYLQTPGLNYWYQYLPSTRTLYFKYNVCEDMANQTFAAFAQNLLATVDHNPVDTFVMDFRQNGGGNSALINPLEAGLAQRLPTLLANPAFQVYGVIDKGTFSSGVDDAGGLKAPISGVNLANVVHLIGEATGGRPDSYGEVSYFLLPHSGLEVDYSTKFIQVPNVPDTPSLVPDVTIPNLSASFFARHDPVLAAIFARATIPPAPTGDVITVSAASFRPEQGLAPGSIATAFGQFPSGADEVDVNGQPSQLFGTSTTSAVFLVPASTAGGPATITVRLGGADVAHGIATITATSPGIFILNDVDPSQPGAVENPDYSVNGQANPAAPGGYLQIYATGAGNGTAPPTVYLADVAVPVLYSDVVGPGLWLVDVQIPNDFPYHGQIPLAIASQGIVSNGVTVWIGQP